MPSICLDGEDAPTASRETQDTARPAPRWGRGWRPPAPKSTWEGDGAAIFAHACKLGAEGIVSKHREHPYRSGPSKAWLKTRIPRRLVCCGSGRGPDRRAPTISAPRFTSAGASSSSQYRELAIAGAVPFVMAMPKRPAASSVGRAATRPYHVSLVRTCGPNRAARWT